MNYPAASYGVSRVKERKLLLTMKLYIFLFPTLFSDVVPEVFFISMTANRVDEESFRPELSSPQLLFDFRNTFKNLPRCYTFHNLAEPSRTERWNRLKQKMNMIRIRSDFNETDLISLTYLQTNLFQLGINLFIENNPAIFGRTDQMIQQYRNIVLFVDKCTHA